MKVLILVQCVDIPGYPEVIKKQQETWDSIDCPGVTVLYYYPSSDKVGIEGRNLYVQGTSSWADMFANLARAFREVINMDWDFIVKTDTSAYINKAELFKILTTKPKTKYYGGEIYEHEHPQNHIEFIWGECMVLSRDVVRLILDVYALNPLIRLGVDDTHVAIILKDIIEPDNSLKICKYYLSEKPVPICHAYRCKKDAEDAVQFEDEIKALEDIHQQLTS